jgi:membrane protease YdiL (CAAX protease family)
MALPVAFLLGFSFNPVDFLWSFHHGLEPMPEEVRERAATIGRYANFLGDALILGFVAVLALRNSLAAARLGLHLYQWKTNAVLGVAAGVLLILMQRLVSKSTPRNSSHPFVYQARRGSVLLWVFIFIVGAFSEELWIALCLVTLAITGHSTSVSVALTAIVFAAVHYGYRLGAFAVALKGIMAALLFLWSGSLILTFLFHFIGNLGSLYRARQDAFERSEGLIR